MNVRKDYVVEYSFNVEMTGSAEYQAWVKLAIAGYPGSGKTLFSSTAPSPFFVFFREQPRIMSIADRYIPHTKITNKYSEDGKLIKPVWDILLGVIEYMESSSGDVYKTFVIDTGDELQQAMKEGKKAQNRGKWSISDWGWLADMYREIVSRIIDLDKHVIITYHLKQTQEGEDGTMFRELALQGAAKDEASGWFDIVGVIDSWEETTEKGAKISHRGILTRTTPRYPFVKDHSGNLDSIFDLSKDFVGDFDRLNEIVYSRTPSSPQQVIETVVVGEKPPPPKADPEGGIPTPEKLKAKKEATAKKKIRKEPEEEEKTELEEKAEPPEKTEPSEGVTNADAIENVQKAFPEATMVSATCEYVVDGEVCGDPLVRPVRDAKGNPVMDSDGNPQVDPDVDLIDLSMIRFRKHMCREHFQEERRKNASN